MADFNKFDTVRLKEGRTRAGITPGKEYTIEMVAKIGVYFINDSGNIDIAFPKGFELVKKFSLEDLAKEMGITYANREVSFTLSNGIEEGIILNSELTEEDINKYIVADLLMLHEKRKENV